MTESGDPPVNPAHVDTMLRTIWRLDAECLQLRMLVKALLLNHPHPDRVADSLERVSEAWISAALPSQVSQQQIDVFQNWAKDRVKWLRGMPPANP